MINIKYTIEFLNNWHCGSGLSAGADVDALVIKDRYGLPYIPGKTIKGLVRHALEEIIEFKGNVDLKDEVKLCFGEERKSLAERDYRSSAEPRGTTFFKNATLSKEISDSIIASKATEFLYESIASTAISKNGIAKKNSLRKIQTTIPCELHGEILGVSDILMLDLQDALAYIKRLGVSRNRGLGRCKFTIDKIEEVQV